LQHGGADRRRPVPIRYDGIGHNGGGRIAHHTELGAPRAAPRKAIDYVSTRRSLLAALSAMALATSVRAQTPMRGNGPPSLHTIRSQFIELRPLADVPEMRLERIDHKMVSLRAFRGKVVLVNFWTT
jgi:hypothetical protein